MKPTDSDLIKALNALPDGDRADLFDFLGASAEEQSTPNQLLDSLAASALLHTPASRTKPN